MSELCGRRARYSGAFAMRGRRLTVSRLQQRSLARLRPRHPGLPDVPRDRSLGRLQGRLKGLQPVVEVTDRGRLEVAGQPHDLPLQLAERDLAVLVPDLELEDGN